MTITHTGLLASAKEFADRALTAYVEDDAAVILAHAATSLEHLAKAVLCSRSPVLLMDIQRGKLDSLVQLAGFPEMARKAQDGPYTISGSQAVDRVGTLFPGIKVPQEITKLTAIRNMTLHVGQHQKDDIRDLLAAYLRLANELFGEMKVPDSERWGKHTDLVESLISKSLDEIERRVAQRIAQVKYKLDSWLSKIPEEMRQSVLDRQQAMATPEVHELQDWVAAKCPVCGQGEALYVGDLIFNPDIHIDAHGRHDVDGGMYELFVERFTCGACGFEAIGAEELAAADLEIVLDVPIEEDYGFIDEDPGTVD
ncbi:hypothetical protein [Actinomadura opuntiae]|uniref:hypothetical protein n=1 Tax=Actinomadura sp. OS1-43 TaxID=604315 RepID=UPI00255A98F9|nr:hypothetical protein [Actinomadura sp. OS1-43]MDL4815988.1 hypothetical protein [Actinomadura sp. OS1-43]